MDGHWHAGALIGAFLSSLANDCYGTLMKQLFKHGVLNSVVRRVLGSILFASAVAAHAAWPSDRAIELVVPFPAGSSPDILARVVAEPLAKDLGQAVVIVNNPGAGGDIGTRSVARAKPDGYTLLYTINGPLVTAPTLFPKTLGYDPVKDLAPISLIATSPNLLIVSEQMGVSDLPSLLAKVRANPDKFNYGSVGDGSASHLAMEMFQTQTGLVMQHIPYKGFPAIINAMLINDIQASFMVPAIAMKHVEAGKIQALAITSLASVPELAGIAPLAEQGLAGFEAISWNAMLAPAGTPESVLKRVSESVARIMQDPAVQKKFASVYFTPVGSTPQELATFMQTETNRWVPVIEQLGLRLD